MRFAPSKFSVWMVLLAAALGVFVPTFTVLVRTFGRRIPQPNLEADYLIALVWALCLGGGILAWPTPKRDRTALLVLWGAKCLVSIGFMLLYEWNYGLDSYNYFAASRDSRSPLGTMGWGSGTENMSGLAWLHARVIPDSYHAMKLTFSMAGLIAVYLVYRSAVRFLGVEDLRLLYLIGLFPSILFWSSILGKDPVQLLGIALYVYGVVGWKCTGKMSFVAPLVLGILVAAFIRLWAAPILIFPLLVFAVRGIRRVSARVAFIVVALVALRTAVLSFADQLNLETASDIYTTAEALSSGWGGGSGQQKSTPFTSLGSMVRFAPLGAFTALFRPLPGEVMNPFALLAGIENAFMLGLVCLALLRTRMARLLEPLVLWALVLVVTWSVVYGFVSYYNLGAAVRFKLQILPVLLLLLLHLSRPGAGQPVASRIKTGEWAYVRA